MSSDRTSDERQAARRARERMRAGLPPEEPSFDPAPEEAEPAVPEPATVEDAGGTDGRAVADERSARPRWRRRTGAGSTHADADGGQGLGEPAVAAADSLDEPPAGTRWVSRGARGARPRQTRGPRGRSSVLRRLAALLVLLLVAAGLWAVFNVVQPGKGKGSGTVVVRIPEGVGAGDVGDLLADKGVVDSGVLFSLRTALAGKRGDLRSGVYTLRRGMSYGAAIDALTKPPAAAPVFSVVIPEGLSIRESRGRIAKAGVRGSYVNAAARRPPRSARAPRSVRTLEGFLFPATYQLRRGATARTLVARQLTAFGENVSGVSLSYARKRNLTLYDVLIIASMVEREAAVQRDRPLIASVIYNRLKARMPLQIDATTRYGIRNWSRPLRQSDFARSGRYDTRRRLGLPPTPIGNPGLASIRAAARPRSTRYVYFVVKPGTCRHSFFRTQARFDAAVARYKAASARRGRSPASC